MIPGLPMEPASTDVTSLLKRYSNESIAIERIHRHLATPIRFAVGEPTG